MKDKKLENMIIITLVLIIGCFLFPIVFSIINNSQEGTIKSTVYGNIDAVKNLYLNEVTNPTSEIVLPFTLEYINRNYRTYCGNEEVFLSNKLEVKGIQPISGKITWGEDDKIVVENLKYRNYTCNKKASGDVECVKNSD